MIILCLLPIVVSSLLIAAHFYRMGSTILAVIAVLLPLLLLIRHKLALNIVRIYLFIATAEWIRALFAFIEIYERGGLSWTRLSVILGGVALFTFSSALLLSCRPLTNYFTNFS